ncbi:MAG: AAA family ATPase [Patescibacteria group bacterium]|nr:AAA family ATPase [Patescibacteria group bacterium]
MQLVIHPKTRQQLDHFIANPSHAVLLSGPAGGGKSAFAKLLVQSVMKVETSFKTNPNVMYITAGKGASIGIESVREIDKFLRLKVPFSRGINRAIIIENGSLLTTEAQNALLKTLEEPPTDTILILTANQPQSLLPTIISRVQQIHLLSPSLGELTSHFELQGFEAFAIKRAYGMTGGLPGLMHAILTNSDHPLVTALDKARLLLGKSTYERLINIDELSKNKELVSNVLFMMQQMAHVSLLSAGEETAKQWRQVLAASFEATTELAVSAQPKLTLTKLMLSL